MTPQQLKSSILQQAIQGKLVPQIPSEGTGEQLYQQIQKEKQAMLKVPPPRGGVGGGAKKEKPLPPISEDEIPFEIPETWRWCRIFDIGIFISGYTPKSNDLSDIGEIPYFKVSDMNTQGNEVFLIHTNNYLKQIPRKVFMKNTIVYPKNGGAVFTNKKRILKFDSVVDLNTGGYYAYRPVDVNFVFVYFKLIDFRQCYKGTALPTIDMDKLRERLIPLPPLAEQKRIVAKIEELMPLIERYEKAWTRLEAINKKFPGDLKKSILQQAIQGKLVPQIASEGTGEQLYQQIQKEKQAMRKAPPPRGGGGGGAKKEKPLPPISEDEIPFEIPETWRWCRFLSIVDIATNIVQPNNYLNYMHIAPDNIEKCSGRLFNCKSVREDKVISGNHLFKKGQIIYSKIRPLLRKVVIAPFDGLCSADMYPLNNTISVNYLLYYILSDGFTNQVANAMSSRVKMPKINQDELGKVLIPLPPLAEQRRIVAKIEELMPLIERLERS